MCTYSSVTCSNPHCEREVIAKETSATYEDPREVEPQECPHCGEDLDWDSCESVSLEELSLEAHPDAA